MSIVEIFAGVEQIGGDLFAIVGLIGAAMMLLFPRKWKNFVEWGVGGVILGAGCFICFLIAGDTNYKIGLLLGTSPAVIAILLFVSLILLVLGWMRHKHPAFL